MLLNYICMYIYNVLYTYPHLPSLWSEVAQSCPILCDPKDSSLHQAPPSMGFSVQEYWSGLPFLSPGNLPDPGIEPRSPTLETDALPSEPPGNKYRYIYINFTLYILYIHMVPLLQNGIWDSSMYKPSSHLRLQNENGIVVRNIVYRFRFPRSRYQFFHILAVWLFTSWSSLYIFKVMYVIIIDQGFKPRAFTNHIKGQLIFW